MDAVMLYHTEEPIFEEVLADFGVPGAEPAASYCTGQLALPLR